MRLRRTGVLLLCGLLGASAWAGPDDARTKAKARFKQGTSYQQAGMFDDAIAEYEAAYALLPEPDFIFNIAQAYRLKGDKAKALDYYRRYTDLAPDGRGNVEAREQVVALTKALREAARNSQGSLIVVGATAAPRDLAVRIDGAPAALGSTVTVSAGKHVVEATATGYLPLREEVEVPAGGTVTVPAGRLAPIAAATAPVGPPGPEVEPPATAPIVAGPSPGRPPRAKGRRMLAYAVGGVGIVGLVAGSVLGLRAKSKWGDVEANCQYIDGEYWCCPDYVATADSARRAGTWSTVTFAVGGAALVSAAVIYFTAPREAATPSVAVTPTPGGAMVLVGGGF